MTQVISAAPEDWINIFYPVLQHLKSCWNFQVVFPHTLRSQRHFQRQLGQKPVGITATAMGHGVEKSFRTTWAHSSGFIQPSAKIKDHGLCSQDRIWFSSSQWVANRNLGAEWQPAMTSQHNTVARAAFGWLTKGEVSGSEKQFSVYRESWSSWHCWICVTLWLIFFKRSLEVLENTALEVKMKRKFPY